jgi:hypothetical protein
MVAEEAGAPAAAVVPARVEWVDRRRPVPAATACAPAAVIARSTSRGSRATTSGVPSAARTWSVSEVNRGR